jgi:hypothetical protein
MTVPRGMRYVADYPGRMVTYRVRYRDDSTQEFTLPWPEQPHRPRDRMWCVRISSPFEEKPPKAPARRRRA